MSSLPRPTGRTLHAALRKIISLVGALGAGALVGWISRGASDACEVGGIAKTTLYNTIAEEVSTLDIYMASAWDGIFNVPELALKFMVWRAIMKNRKKLFGNRAVRSQWDKDWMLFN